MNMYRLPIDNCAANYRCHDPVDELAAVQLPAGP